GGIANDATLTLTNSTVSANSTAAGDNQGGGIANPSGAVSMTLLGDTITNNSAGEFGGGVDIDNGTASITNTTITNNSGPSDGGGLDIDTVLPVAFVNDTINGNTTGTTGA